MIPVEEQLDMKRNINTARGGRERGEEGVKERSNDKVNEKRTKSGESGGKKKLADH